MSKLDRALEALNNIFKGTLEINVGLETVERRSEFNEAINTMYDGFSRQINRLLKSDLFDDINSAIGKSERVYTESDYLEIQDAVLANMESIGGQKVDGHILEDTITDFLILIFNLGGQSFLNTHNIPATFNLTNEGVISSIKQSTNVTLKGIDETTTKWITDRIYDGRTKGLSNSAIVDVIKEKVPKTYANRADAIVRTETSRMVGESQAEAANNNGAAHKRWITVGGACPICQANESQGMIGVNQGFQSGNMQEPAHPNCRCVVEYLFTPFQGTIWSGQ